MFVNMITALTFFILWIIALCNPYEQDIENE